MSNEILLVLSIFIIYGSVIVMYKLFGKQGLFCFTSIATIAANIEVFNNGQSIWNGYDIGKRFICVDIPYNRHCK